MWVQKNGIKGATGFGWPHFPHRQPCQGQRILTLVYLQKGFWEFVCHQWLRQISKILLQHVCHVISRLSLIVDTVYGAFIHLAQSLNPGFDTRFSEESNLCWKNKTKCKVSRGKQHFHCRTRRWCMHLSSHDYVGPADVSSHLIQTMVAEVAHGLLDALGEGLSCALHVDCQRDSEYIPVLVVWNLDPFHELGHSPIEKILRSEGIHLLTFCTFCPSLQVNHVGSRSVLISWRFQFKQNYKFSPSVVSATLWALDSHLCLVAITGLCKYGPFLPLQKSPLDSAVLDFLTFGAMRPNNISSAGDSPSTVSSENGVCLLKGEDGLPSKTAAQEGTRGESYSQDPK